MGLSLEGAIKTPTFPTINGRALFKEPAATGLEVDLSVFGVREIRDVLKSKAHCLHAGFSSNHMIIQTLNEIRMAYIHRVGLPTYLNQMLGDVGNVPIQCCRLYSEDNHPIRLRFKGDHDQPAQRYIARHFRRDRLPFKIETCKDSNPERVEVRYL